MRPTEQVMTRGTSGAGNSVTDEFPTTRTVAVGDMSLRDLRMLQDRITGRPVNFRPDPEPGTPRAPQPLRSGPVPLLAGIKLDKHVAGHGLSGCAGRTKRSRDPSALPRVVRDRGVSDDSDSGSEFLSEDGSLSDGSDGVGGGATDDSPEGGEGKEDAGVGVEEAEVNGDPVVYPPLNALELSEEEKGIVQHAPDIDSAQFFVPPAQLDMMSPLGWSLFPGREKWVTERKATAAGFPCVVLTSPWVVRIPAEYRMEYLRRLRAVHHTRYPRASTEYLVTEHYYCLDGTQVASILDGLELVLVEGFGMKLCVSIAVPKYDQYRQGVTVASQRVALDVGFSHLPQFRNTLMVFGVEKYDTTGVRF